MKGALRMCLVSSCILGAVSLRSAKMETIMFAPTHALSSVGGMDGVSGRDVGYIETTDDTKRAGFLLDFEKGTIRSESKGYEPESIEKIGDGLLFHLDRKSLRNGSLNVELQGDKSYVWRGDGNLDVSLSKLCRLKVFRISVEVKKDADGNTFDTLWIVKSADEDPRLVAGKDAVIADPVLNMQTSVVSGFYLEGDARKNVRIVVTPDCAELLKRMARLELLSIEIEDKTRRKPAFCVAGSTAFMTIGSETPSFQTGNPWMTMEDPDDTRLFRYELKYRLKSGDASGDAAQQWEVAMNNNYDKVLTVSEEELHRIMDVIRSKSQFLRNKENGKLGARFDLDSGYIVSNTAIGRFATVPYVFEDSYDSVVIPFEDEKYVLNCPEEFYLVLMRRPFEIQFKPPTSDDNILIIRQEKNKPLEYEVIVRGYSGDNRRYTGLEYPELFPEQNILVLYRPVDGESDKRDGKPAESVDGSVATKYKPVECRLTENAKKLLHCLAFGPSCSQAKKLGIFKRVLKKALNENYNYEETNPWTRFSSRVMPYDGTTWTVKYRRLHQLELESGGNIDYQNRQLHGFGHGDHEVVVNENSIAAFRTTKMDTEVIMSIVRSGLFADQACHVDGKNKSSLSGFLLSPPYHYLVSKNMVWRIPRFDVVVSGSETEGKEDERSIASISIVFREMPYTIMLQPNAISGVLTNLLKSGHVRVTFRHSLCSEEGADKVLRMERESADRDGDSHMFKIYGGPLIDLVTREKAGAPEQIADSDIIRSNQLSKAVISESDGVLTAEYLHGEKTGVVKAEDEEKSDAESRLVKLKLHPNCVALIKTILESEDESIKGALPITIV